MSVNLSDYETPWERTRRTSHHDRRTPAVPQPASSLANDLPSLVSLVILAVMVAYLFLR